MKHVIVPTLGMVANIGMLVGIVYMSVSSGGSTQTDTLIALGIVGVWIVVGAAWLVFNSATTKTVCWSNLSSSRVQNVNNSGTWIAPDTSLSETASVAPPRRRGLNPSPRKR